MAVTIYLPVKYKRNGFCETILKKGTISMNPSNGYLLSFHFMSQATEYESINVITIRYDHNEESNRGMELISLTLRISYVYPNSIISAYPNSVIIES